jgi:hypothetical protein
MPTIHNYSKPKDQKYFYNLQLEICKRCKLDEHWGQRKKVVQKSHGESKNISAYYS